MTEFNTKTPDIFREHGVAIVYGETSRSARAHSALDGNMSDTPVVLSEKNYKMSGSDHGIDRWRSREADAVSSRRHHLMSQMGIQRLARPRTLHGSEIIDATSNMHLLNGSEHSVADIAYVDRLGDGILMAPADCAILAISWDKYAINKADAGDGFAALAHVGIRGVAREVIPKAFDHFAQMGLQPGDAVVHIGPFAHEFQMNQQEIDELHDILEHANTDTQREYMAHTRSTDGKTTMDIRSVIQEQLARSGVGLSRTSIDPRNTLTDAHLFSAYNADYHGAVNGRNGIIAGISRNKS